MPAANRKMLMWMNLSRLSTPANSAETKYRSSASNENKIASNPGVKPPYHEVSITAARKSEYAVVAKRLRAESVNRSAAITLMTLVRYRSETGRGCVTSQSNKTADISHSTGLDGKTPRILATTQCGSSVHLRK